MKYNEVVRAEFLERPNRFIAKVLLENGETETVHVKNTGRCKELLIPGSQVILEKAKNPDRKTQYDLIAVYKKVDQSTLLVNMDSQICNHVVREYLEKEMSDWTIQPEKTIGDSRLDFFLQKGSEEIWMEVKGCTLEKDGIGYFPDAPSKRAVKHVRELQKLAKDGKRAVAAFVIQMDGVSQCLPSKTDPAFEAALDEARMNGVEVWVFHCHVEEDSIEITDRLVQDGRKTEKETEDRKNILTCQGGNE